MSTLLSHQYSHFRTLDYPDYLFKFQRVRIIEVQLYYSDRQFLNIFLVWPYTSTICIKGVGQTWVRHCPITNKYWCQGCALRKIEGSPVLWTCEILGAQHIISIEKVTFSSCPGANLVAKGYRTLLVLTALYLLQIWLMLILLLLADLCAKDKEFPL